MQYLFKITNSHNCGHDNISSSTLKCIAHEICDFFPMKILIENQQNSSHKKERYIHIYTEEKNNTK